MVHKMRPELEKGLLRHTLNHLLQLLDSDVENCFPEEVYLHPPLVPTLQTGSIVKRKAEDVFFVVLNPACDLIVRGNGDFKTDRILLVEIDNDQIMDEVRGMQNSRNGKQLKKIENCQYHHPESECYKSAVNASKESLERCVAGFLRNTHDLFHHWLPQTDYFPGGFLNFRKLSTRTKSEFEAEFDSPEIQISPSFVKDVIARFSSYYARQGQPDIDSSTFLNKLTVPIQDKK